MTIHSTPTPAVTSATLLDKITHAMTRVHEVLTATDQRPEAVKARLAIASHAVNTVIAASCEAVSLRQTTSRAVIACGRQALLAIEQAGDPDCRDRGYRLRTANAALHGAQTTILNAGAKP